MKIWCFVLLLFTTCAAAQNRHVPLITLNQLNSRVARGTDTTYIINFWATWCVPCLNELPAFEKLNKTGKTEKLKVVLVSVDLASEGRRSLPMVIKKKKLQSEVWLLNEKNQQAFIDQVYPGWSGAIPATLMIKNNRRRFFENEFTYQQLLTEYRNLQ